MKNLLLLSVLGLLWACNGAGEKAHDHAKMAHEEATSEHNHSEMKTEESEKKKPLSPRTMAMANIGDNHVHVDYGSPGKRGRVIFGGLVGYGNVWATGAHKATVISFGKDVLINGKSISAGKYGLFTIPGEKEWTIIINKDWDMHLADNYTEANDIVRIKSPVQTLDTIVESLTFEVVPSKGDQSRVNISWDMVKVGFEIKNK